MNSAAEWAQALAAVAALVVAVRALRSTRKLYVIESERDKQYRERRRRKQASGMHAWVAVRLLGGDRLDGLVIENTSDAPMYDVHIHRTKKHGSNEPILNLHIVPPGRYFTARERNNTFSWTYPDAVESLAGTVRPVMKKPTWAVTRVEFRDAAGLCWVRERDGRLVEVDGPVLEEETLESA